MFCSHCAGLYVYNKIDVCSMEEVDEIARRPHSIPISCYQKLNFDGLLARIWEMMVGRLVVLVSVVRGYVCSWGAAPVLCVWLDVFRPDSCGGTPAPTHTHTCTLIARRSP